MLSTTLAGEMGKSRERRIEKDKKYRCSVCNYIYDLYNPEVNDSGAGIKPETSFENLIKANCDGP